MSVVIKQNTVDVSSSIEKQSVRLLRALTSEVGRLSFSIKNYGTKVTCNLGDQIDLYEDSVHLFGGTVTAKEEEVVGGILVATNYTANDWSFRLNSKLVVQSYANANPHDIVADIISTFTDGTFTTTNVETGGFDVISIKFNYEPVTVALEKLAKQIGWEWYVDADKDLHFFPPNTVVSAPYTIDDTSGNLQWATLNIDRSLINMKNSIYVIGGTYTKVFTSVTTPDRYLTDGTRSVFGLAYRYTPSTLVVTLNSVSQTIGTDQVTNESSVQVLYNEGERFVRFTTTPVTTALVVSAYGSAQIPILAHVQNQAAVAAYGEIQDVIIDQQISSIEEAQQRGNAQITQYGAPVYATKFTTLRTGFDVGQTVQVDSTIFNTDILVVVKRISSRMRTPTTMEHTIECVGAEKVKFVDIMKMLLLRSQAETVVDDSTVLQVLLLLEESVTLADTLNAPTSTTGPYTYDTTAKYNFATYS